MVGKPLSQCVVKVVSLDNTDFDASSALKSRLSALGATIRINYVKGLTHIVLARSYRADENSIEDEKVLAEVIDKAKSAGAEAVKVVTPLWVHRSETLGHQAAEAPFLVECSGHVPLMGRRKRKQRKSALPADLDRLCLDLNNALFSSTQAMQDSDAIAAPPKAVRRAKSLALQNQHARAGTRQTRASAAALDSLQDDDFRDTKRRKSAPTRRQHNTAGRNDVGAMTQVAVEGLLDMASGPAALPSPEHRPRRRCSAAAPPNPSSGSGPSRWPSSRRLHTRSAARACASPAQPTLPRPQSDTPHRPLTRGAQAALDSAHGKALHWGSTGSRGPRARSGHGSAIAPEARLPAVFVPDSSDGSSSGDDSSPGQDAALQSPKGRPQRCTISWRQLKRRISVPMPVLHDVSLTLSQKEVPPSAGTTPVQSLPVRSTCTEPLIAQGTDIPVPGARMLSDDSDSLSGHPVALLPGRQAGCQHILPTAATLADRDLHMTPRQALITGVWTDSRPWDVIDNVVEFPGADDLQGSDVVIPDSDDDGGSQPDLSCADLPPGNTQQLIQQLARRHALDSSPVRTARRSRGPVASSVRVSRGHARTAAERDAVPQRGSLPASRVSDLSGGGRKAKRSAAMDQRADDASLRDDGGTDAALRGRHKPARPLAAEKENAGRQSAAAQGGEARAVEQPSSLRRSLRRVAGGAAAAGGSGGHGAVLTNRPNRGASAGPRKHSIGLAADCVAAEGGGPALRTRRRTTDAAPGAANGALLHSAGCAAKSGTASRGASPVLRAGAGAASGACATGGGAACIESAEEADHDTGRLMSSASDSDFATEMPQRALGSRAGKRRERGADAMGMRRAAIRSAKAARDPGMTTAEAKVASNHRKRARVPESADCKSSSPPVSARPADSGMRLAAKRPRCRSRTPAGVHDALNGMSPMCATQDVPLALRAVPPRSAALKPASNGCSLQASDWRAGLTPGLANGVTIPVSDPVQLAGCSTQDVPLALRRPDTRPATRSARQVGGSGVVGAPASRRRVEARAASGRRTGRQHEGCPADESAMDSAGGAPTQLRIACTSVDGDFVSLCRTAVRRLPSGGATLLLAEEELYAAHVTHLVIGQDRRTIKALLGACCGACLVSKEWVYASIEARRWLPAGAFPARTHLTDTARRARRWMAGEEPPPLQRIKCALVAVGSMSAQHVGALKALVKRLGGEVCGPRGCDVCVMCRNDGKRRPVSERGAVPRVLAKGAAVVTDDWLLASAETGRLQQYSAFQVPA